MKDNQNAIKTEVSDDKLCRVNGGANNAKEALKVIDNALQRALEQEASIGAQMNRLEFTSGNLSTASENLPSADAVYGDADPAKQMTGFIENNILLQTAQTMLSKANLKN